MGSWLVEHLRVARRRRRADRQRGRRNRSGALREALVASEPDAVYHLAALTHVGRSYEDPVAVVRVNALGTLSVLEAARACPQAPRVLVVSSAEVYGAVEEKELPLREESPLAPMSPYAASKIAAEFLAIQAHLAYGTRDDTGTSFQSRRARAVDQLRGACARGSDHRSKADRRDVDPRRQSRRQEGPDRRT